MTAIVLTSQHKPLNIFIGDIYYMGEFIKYKYLYLPCIYSVNELYIVHF